MEKKVGQKAERPDPEANDTIRLNEDLKLLEASLRKYFDDRLKNLPESLAEPAEPKASEDLAMRSSDRRWSWRFDVYFLLALALLGFLIWPRFQEFAPSTTPAAENGTGGRPDGNETEGSQPSENGGTDEQASPPPVEKDKGEGDGKKAKEDGKDAGTAVTTAATGDGKDAPAKTTPEGGSSDKKTHPQAPAAGEKSPDGRQVGEEESKVDAGTPADQAASTSELTDKGKGTEETGGTEETWWAPIRDRLAGFSDTVAKRRADLYFLIVAGLLGAVLWKLRSIGSGGGGAHAAPQRLGMVWYLKKGWRYRPWRKALRRDPKRAVAWLDQLRQGAMLSPEQIDLRWEADIQRWCDTLAAGRELGDVDSEVCVRLLFQYFYARWRTQKASTGRLGPGFVLPRITGERGVLSKDDLMELAQDIGLGATVAGLDPEEPRAQVTVVVHWLKVRFLETGS